MISIPWSKRILDFWSKPIAPEPLALFRVLVGAAIFVSSLSSLWPYLDRYIGPDGLCAVEEVDGWLNDSCRFCLLRGPMNVPVLQSILTPEQKSAWAEWGDQPGNIRLLFRIWLVALACMTVGFCTWPATLVSWALAITFHRRMSWLRNGGDDLVVNALFYLLFAPSGAAWSLDNRLWKRPARLIPPWSVRLMQIQLCLIYLATGTSKLNDDWLRGVAVYWVLNDVAVARWPFCVLPLPMFLSQLASWGTLLFEIGFSPLVCFQRIRPWLLSAGVLFHAGIWATCEIGWFSQLMLCWYALFLTPQAAERGLRFITGQWLRSPQR